MNILILTRYFPPEIGTAANLFFELANGLKGNGHNVTVVTGFPWYNLEKIPDKYKNKIYMKDVVDKVDVIRLKFPIVGPKKLKLAVGHLTAPLISFFGGMLAKKVDLVFIYSPPIFMGLSGWLLNVCRSVPFIFGVQDLHPQCYIDQGLLKNRLAIKLLEAIEKFCYRKASLITVHSEGNKKHITEIKGINENKVQVLPNWIDTDEITPLPRDNYFSQQYDLNGKFVVGYAGTLGMSQGLMSIIEAANILRNRDDIEFFIVGDGIEKKKMMNKTSKLGLNNVKFIDMQTKAVYPYVVASSDVGLVTLNSKVNTPVVPSKILSMMAASRTVLASMPLEGDAPKLIEAAQCGICISPENPSELAKKIIYLAENRDICTMFGSQGREYVIKNLSLHKVINEIERIFEEAISYDTASIRGKA